MSFGWSWMYRPSKYACTRLTNFATTVSFCSLGEEREKAREGGREREGGRREEKDGGKRGRREEGGMVGREQREGEK